MATEVDPYRRDPGGPFDDFKKELYCQARAKGGSSKASSVEAGIEYKTALKWERHPSIKERIFKELRRGIQSFTVINKAGIVVELMKNMQMAREAEPPQLKSSNEALKLAYEIISKDPDLANNTPIAADPRTVEERAADFIARRTLAATSSAQVIDTSLTSDSEEEEELAG